MNELKKHLVDYMNIDEKSIGTTPMYLYIPNRLTVKEFFEILENGYKKDYLNKISCITDDLIIEKIEIVKWVNYISSDNYPKEITVKFNFKNNHLFLKLNYIYEDGEWNMVSHEPKFIKEHIELYQIIFDCRKLIQRYIVFYINEYYK